MSAPLMLARMPSTWSMCSTGSSVAVAQRSMDRLVVPIVVAADFRAWSAIQLRRVHVVAVVISIALLTVFSVFSSVATSIRIFVAHAAVGSWSFSAAVPALRVISTTISAAAAAAAVSLVRHSRFRCRANEAEERYWFLDCF